MKTQLLISASVVLMTLLAMELFHSQNSEPLRVRGLDTLALDRWSAKLLEHPASAARISASESFIAHSFARTLGRDASQKSLETFFDDLVKGAARASETSSDYEELATVLYRARDSIRTTSLTESAREALLLLTLLSEETLAVRNWKFPPSAANPWIVRTSVADSPCANHRAADSFHGIPLCSGDTVISKGEEFSSALILFRAPLTATFSHSAFALGDGHDEKLRLLEAEGFGGGLTALADDAPPLRTSVYRLKASLNPDGKITEAASKRAREMIGLKPGALFSSLASPTNLFRFNLSLKPECRERQYYCSELTYCLYSESHVEGDLNPLPPRLWTKTTENVQDFIGKIWNVYWGDVPSPADLELNPNYELVGHRVELGRLEKTRVQFMTLNALMRLLTQDASLGKEYLHALEHFGDRSVQTANAEDYKQITRLGFIKREELTLVRQRLPSDLRLREVIFYYHIQNHVLPRVEEEVARVIRGTPETFPSLGRLDSLATPLLRKELTFFTRGVEQYFASPENSR